MRLTDKQLEDLKATVPACHGLHAGMDAAHAASNPRIDDVFGNLAKGKAKPKSKK